MADLKSKKLIIAKGVLFLLLGILSLTYIILETRSIALLLLIFITIWAFCRFYYFLFYVIENYLDAKYKFAGIGRLIIYLLRKRD